MLSILGGVKSFPKAFCFHPNFWDLGPRKREGSEQLLPPRYHQEVSGLIECTSEAMAWILIVWGAQEQSCWFEFHPRPDHLLAMQTQVNDFTSLSLCLLIWPFWTSWTWQFLSVLIFIRLKRKKEKCSLSTSHMSDTFYTLGYSGSLPLRGLHPSSNVLWTPKSLWRIHPVFLCLYISGKEMGQGLPRIERKAYGWLIATLLVSRTTVLLPSKIF